MAGKLFQQTIYDLSGEILALQSLDALPVPTGFSFTYSLAQAWQLLIMIKDHDTPWIEPSKKWANYPLAKLLYRFGM